MRLPSLQTTHVCTDSLGGSGSIQGFMWMGVIHHGIYVYQ